MKKIKPGSLLGCLSVTAGKFLITALAAAIHTTALAQADVHSYNFVDFDLKHFSIEKVPVGNRYVMSGTTYNNALVAGNYPAFYFVDNVGDPLNGAMQFYYDANSQDDRGVDITRSNTANRFWITAMQIRVPYGTGNDDIKLIQVDNSGGINPSPFSLGAGMNSWRIYLSYGGYENFYPLHSLRIGSDLYICGFIGDNYAGQVQPDYANNRQSFIIRVDLSGGTLTIGAAAMYNTAQTGANDYDKIHRLAEVGGVLYAVGSCNGDDGSGNELSSTLLLDIDPTTLTVNNNLSHHDASHSHGHEFGVDVIRDGLASGGIYAIGNTYVHATTLFDTRPTEVSATFINGGVMTGNSRFQTNAGFAPGNLWGIHAVPAANGGSFTIAGMQAEDFSCGLSPASDIDNIHPYLSEWDLGIYNGTNFPGPGITDWVTYTALMGTFPSGNANSYWQLGDGYAVNSWNPTFATLNTTTTEYLMTAPLDMGMSGMLNLKWLRATGGNKQPTNCTGSFANCPPPPTDYDVHDQHLGMLTETLVSAADVGLDEISSTAYDVPITDVDMSTCDDVNGTANYRMAGSSTGDPMNVRIFPNPAKDFVHMLVSGDIAAGIQARAELYNLMGQHIATLYEGPAENINGTPMKLPAVAAGIYQLKVYTDGKLLSQHKLNIQ